MKKNLPLLPIESSLLAKYIIGVSSISFFEGDLQKSKAFIEERFKNVCELNPWLLGRLIDKKSSDLLVLEYDEEIRDEILNKALHYNSKNSNLKINSKMDYETILKQTAPYLVQNPKTIINTDALVSALVFQPLEDKANEFAMIFSLSHSIVDGHSYYKILNMLFADEKIIALNVERKSNLSTKLKEAVSLSSYNYFASFAHVGNALRGSIFAKKSRASAYYIDDDKINRAKSQKIDTLPFVSSNDIITSGFFSLIGARVGFMAVNFRDKIKGLVQEDAGNYEGAILYDKEIYSSPSLIRKYLSQGIPYPTTSRPLPQFLEALFCKLGLISNWSSFAKELRVGNAKQVLHLPLLGNISYSPYDVCIIFRANKDKKGIVLIHKNLSQREILSAIPLNSLEIKYSARL